MTERCPSINDQVCLIQRPLGHWEFDIGHSLETTPIKLDFNHTVAACYGSTRRLESMARQRVRIQFAKQGDLRLISHRDLMRTWERLFRRACVAVCMTEGFHPKPKMMFPSALAVGIEGWDEVLEIELPEERDPEPLAELLRLEAPPGLVIHGVKPATGGKTKLRGMTFQVEVPAERRASVAGRLAWLQQQQSYPVAREGRAAPIELVSLIDELLLDGDGTLHMRLRVAADGSARPREVLEALGLADVEDLGIVMRRTAVELSPS